MVDKSRTDLFCWHGSHVLFSERSTVAGDPRRGKQILLLDENGHEVGPYQPGEIAVKGRGHASGYWKNTDRANAKFVSDPGGGDERIYLTGDYGRMLPDGFLIHLERKDFMVKIRGYRVEVVEIEKALQAHPRVGTQELSHGIESRGRNTWSHT